VREPIDDFGGGCQRGRHGPGCCGRQGSGRRARKGWIRSAILALLAERPRHGYEMISELSERTGGAWMPSPGAVYPALQLLADEGLIESAADGGRRRYTLTEAGAAALAGLDESAPWASMVPTVDPADAALREAVAKADAAAAQVLATGTPEQKTGARAVLVEARRALYRILAEDD
jgi:DNA-binding PadR family transcriptional regulator